MSEHGMEKPWEKNVLRYLCVNVVFSLARRKEKKKKSKIGLVGIYLSSYLFLSLGIEPYLLGTVR